MIWSLLISSRGILHNPLKHLLQVLQSSFLLNNFYTCCSVCLETLLSALHMKDFYPLGLSLNSPFPESTYMIRSSLLPVNSFDLFTNLLQLCICICVYIIVFFYLVLYMFGILHNGFFNGKIFIDKLFLLS